MYYQSFHQLQKDVQRQHRRHESSRFDSRSRRQGRPQVHQDVQAGREEASGKIICSYHKNVALTFPV